MTLTPRQRRAITKPLSLREEPKTEAWQHEAAHENRYKSLEARRRLDMRLARGEDLEGAKRAVLKELWPHEFRSGENEPPDDAGA